MVGRYTASEVEPKPRLWYARPLLPNIAKLGELESVAITFFVSPTANDASILMSSPAPVGMFLICNAAITEPPHLSEGRRLISDTLFGTRKPPIVEACSILYDAFTSCAAAENWNRPQA